MFFIKIDDEHSLLAKTLAQGAGGLNEIMMRVHQEIIIVE
jgi:hypothetical protein